MYEVNFVQRNRIKDLREDNDRTQQEIADYLCVAQNTYCNYENGRHQIPIAQLIRLAEYYNVNLDYLLGRTDVKDPLPPSKRPIL